MLSAEPGPRPGLSLTPLRPRVTMALVIAATALGLGLRLHQLGRLGLELDEGLYSFIADLPIRRLPGYLSLNESTPPLFLIMLKAWQGLLRSDIGIRLLSVAIGTIAIPVMYLAGRRILGTTGGLAAAFFLAVAPFHVLYSRVAKNPSLFFLLTLCALLALLAVSQGKARRLAWAGFSLALAGMLYTHGLAPVFMIGLGAVFLVRAKIPWTAHLRPWLIAHLVAGLLFLPWLGVALKQIKGTLDHFWAPRPSIILPIITAAKFTLMRPEPSPIGSAEMPPADQGLASRRPAGPTLDRIMGWLWFLPAGATFVLSAWLLLSTGRWRVLWVIASLFVVPVGVVWLVSQFTASVYIHRALLPGLIPIPLLLAVPFGILAAPPDGAGSGFEISPRPPRPRLLRWALSASLASFFVLLSSSWRVTEAHPGEQFREAASVIRERARDGDALVFDAHFGQILFERYLGADSKRFVMYGLPVGVSDLEMPDWRPRVSSEKDLAPLVTAASRHAALWLVLSHTEIHDRNGLAAKWCRENLRQTEVHRFVGVVLARYETRRE